MLRSILTSVVAFCLVISLSLTITEKAFYRIAPVETDFNVISLKERQRQLTCLAENIYYEGAGEHAEGKIAIAQVTLNRVEHSKFPNDVCKVVYERNKVTCQFSWYCDKPKGLRVRNQAAYDESMRVAKAVLLEGERLPSLDKAIFYHADYVAPGWKYPKLAKIGKHIFYEHP